MITLRRSDDRGHFNFGWLDTRHTFSFGDYYDPKFMGHGPLRVINEDRVKPGQGFPTHPHRDMEIVTYVLEGALEHKDSMGNGSVIRAGDVQRMSAGTGVTHSEFNSSKTEPVHLLQIWILPERNNLAPSYEQKFFSQEVKTDRFCLIGSQDGSEGSVTIHQNVRLYASILSTERSFEHKLSKGSGWIQVVSGSLAVNELSLSAGDGASIDNESDVLFSPKSKTEFLLFDF